MEDYSKQLDELLQQENDLRFSEFSNLTAIQLGNAIIERALNEEKLVTVDIRRNNQVLFHAKMNGCTPGNDRWIERKINVVNHFEHSSYYMNVLYQSWNTTVQDNAFVDAMEYAAEGGCFPLLLKNVSGHIGTISVSGLSGKEDHEMITNTLKQFLNVD